MTTATQADEWVAGRCWLYCGSPWTWVTWIGPVRLPSGTDVPMYACAPCLDQLAGIAWQEVARKDAPRPRQHATP
jgi:hypothetical protein